MSSEISTVLVRELADFHPNLWGDQFANHQADDKVSGDVEERRNELKEKVKQELMISTAMNPSMQLQLIGDIERLGIGYHFEKEIEEALTHVHEAHNDYEVNNQDDLYHVSLRFRLLRQQGFNVSCGKVIFWIPKVHFQPTYLLKKTSKPTLQEG